MGQTCDLIQHFPEYLDVVVSVARKTDGRHWADLFSAAGRSTEYDNLLLSAKSRLMILCHNGFVMGFRFVYLYVWLHISVNAHVCLLE